MENDKNSEISLAFYITIKIGKKYYVPYNTNTKFNIAQKDIHRIHVDNVLLTPSKRPNLETCLTLHIGKEISKKSRHYNAGTDLPIYHPTRNTGLNIKITR